MSGHKLLQYRTHIYKGFRMQEKLARQLKVDRSTGFSILAKCGVYKRKLRACMDQVERELYNGRTRKEVKLWLPNLFKTCKAWQVFINIYTF